MHHGYVHGRLLFAMFLALPCTGCLSHDERTAVYLFRLQQQQALKATQGFLAAAADRDTTAMREFAADSLVMMTLRGETAGFRAASESLTPTQFEVARCRGRLEFGYRVGGEPRIGAADIACRDDGWVITRIALVVEY